jgi:hypothetical protein
MKNVRFPQTAIGVVILAVIAGLAVNALQRILDDRASPKLGIIKPLQSGTQSTFGNGSPIVSNIGGNVVISGKQ